MPLAEHVRGERYTILAYHREGENSQVAEYLEELDERERKRATALIMGAAQHGPSKSEQKSRKLAGEDFFEFKPTNQVRIFWCYAKGWRIILLYAFRKKSGRTSERDLNAGRTRYKEVRSEID